MAGGEETPTVTADVHTKLQGFSRVYYCTWPTGVPTGTLRVPVCMVLYSTTSTIAMPPYPVPDATSSFLAKSRDVVPVVPGSE